MKISRRDLLKFAAGSAAGALLTPMPWKVLDDSAIWTQNWPWIPTPATGESRMSFTTCTLCPAGCGMRARCISGQPVSLVGVAEHPVSQGALCPIGLAAHHLPYHPARAAEPLLRTVKFGTVSQSPVTLDAAIDAIAGAIRNSTAGESVAILDQQPERTISHFYRRLVSRMPNGVYLRSPMVEDATLRTTAAMLGNSRLQLGFDLEHAATIVSFGAPLLDGWGTPGRMMHLVSGKRNGARPTIIQIETRQSRTALAADRWVPLKPGTEVALALGLANILIEDRLCDTAALQRFAADFTTDPGRSYSSLVARCTPEKTAEITGVSADALRSIARQMKAGGPTVVIGGGDAAGGPLGREEDLAIAGLNFLLGSVGTIGGIVARGEIPASPAEPTTVAARTIEEIPDRSIRVLLLDAAEAGHAIPWSLLERKLADEKAIVVSFSPFLAGLSRHAAYIIPSPTFLESWQDVPTPFDAPAASLSISAQLQAPPAGTTEPADVVQRLGSALGLTIERAGSAYADDLKARAQAVFAAGRGSVFNPADKSTVPVNSLDAEKFWTILSTGGCWVDEEKHAALPARFSLLGGSPANYQLLAKAIEGRLHNGGSQEASYPLAIMPFGWHSAAATAQISPVMSKVYQESQLRSTANQAFINPETAASFGLKNGSAALVETASGSLRVAVHADQSVMPGVLHVAVGPDPEVINLRTDAGEPTAYSACTIESDGVWRVTAAKVREA